MDREARTHSSRRLLAFLASCIVLTCKRPAELPELGVVPDFVLRDQQAATVHVEVLKGKVWAAAFMFTRCPTVCPRITRRMRELQVAAQEAHVPLQLVSFSVDPEYDTPTVLAAYAREYQAESSSWRFLTGDIETVKRIAMDGFKVALEGRASPKSEHFGILHGSHLVLVDRRLRIRGYYRTSDASEMARLFEDARGLVAGS